MSSHDKNNDEIDQEESVDEVETPTTGKKRTSTHTSTSELPPKSRKRPAHRADVWQYFIQKEDDPTLASCRYCGQEIGCDIKKTGTSPMRAHIKICKLFKSFQESGSQQVLAGDSSGVMTAV